MINMDLKLTGQVAVVVGAANGIGRAIARAFAEEGAQVALLDREPAVADLAGQWRAVYKGKLLGLVVDVTDYGALRQAAGQVEQELGPVAHVIFTVGIGSGKTGFPFWNVEPERWGSVLQVNLLGAVHTIHAFLPPMIERRQGTFLFLASVAGQIGSQTDPPYSASKAGLISFAQCAAKDLAAYNIRVNILNPGMVNTQLNRAIWAASNQRLPPEERPDFETWAAEKIKRMVPLNRWQEPEDIANMAVFLASDRARNVTGQCVNVDGGFVMHS
jgi:NAD(P)-dependent dehydrogenase (short-subunit alcohol dehydrogenase family)